MTTTSFSLIDNILTNITDLRSSCGVLITDITDHYPVFCKSCASVSSKNIVYNCRNYSENNITNFISQTEDINWDSVLNDFNVNSSFEKFNCKLSSLYTKCFPFVKISRKNKKGIHG